MKFGFFDDENREYVINNPQTPYPWINYLGNESFFSILSNTCGGYSFYKDARLRRITRYRYNDVNLDSNGKYLYIKDGEESWNPGWKPLKKELDSYECRHGLGYSSFNSSYNNLKAELLTFVPLNKDIEVQRLRLKNKGDTIKNIKLFSFVEFCLWDALDDSTNFQRNFSIGRAECIDNAIVHFTDYRDRRNHYAFHATNIDISGFDCDRESFTGTHFGLDNPQVLKSGKSNNSRAFGWSPVASLNIEIDLKPGEEKDVVFMLGYIENDADKKWDAEGKINTSKMKALIESFSSNERVEEELEQLKNFWNNLLASFRVHAPNEHVNRMINIWNQYQCMVTFNLSRSASYFESGIGRGMGFRDSTQDLLGFVHQIPERARERLIDLASTQLEDGGAYHQYQPLTKKGNADVGSGFNDDPLWLISAVTAYIKETGDFSILDEQVPFNNDPSTVQSMFEHLKRAFYHVVNNKGPHGLPLIGRADWNDCLNLNIYNEDPSVSFQTGPQKTDGMTAESMMIAGAFVLFGNDYAELCRQTGKENEAKLADEHIKSMRIAIDTYGWDGEWFLRAYDAKGNPVGSKSNDLGKIFIESQGFCGMAGIGLEDGRLQQALDSVKKELDTDYGIVLVSPAFSNYKIEYGEISTFLEGYKENGGIFCHNNPWIIIAETILGRGDYAFDYWQKICPSYTEEQSEVHRTEPYVYPQMIGGKEAFRPGEAKNSWLTGTAAWNFVAISQYILGVKPDYDGLLIDPVIPPDWKEVYIERTFRKAKYLITIQNPDQIMKGIKEVYLNDQLLLDNKIPVMKENSENKVTVVMG